MKQEPKVTIRYDVISPDGLPIGPGPGTSDEPAESWFFASIEDATKAFIEWSTRYRIPGYYRDNRMQKIPLDLLHHYCEIAEIELENDDDNSFVYTGNYFEIELPSNKQLAMINKAMQTKLQEGTCIDVSHERQENGDYLLSEFVEGKDYCDAVREIWIWHIFQADDGQFIASSNPELFTNPKYKLIWTR